MKEALVSVFSINCIKIEMRKFGTLGGNISENSCSEGKVWIRILIQQSSFTTYIGSDMVLALSRLVLMFPRILSSGA